MGKGDAKLELAKLKAQVELWKKQGRKVGLTALTKDQVAALVASFEVGEVEAYTVEEEAAGATTTVMMIVSPTKVEQD